MWYYKEYIIDIFQINDTHREKLFYSVQYKNDSFSVINLFSYVRISIKIYTFHYHILKSKMFEKDDSSNRQ